MEGACLIHISYFSIETRGWKFEQIDLYDFFHRRRPVTR